MTAVDPTFVLKELQALHFDNTFNPYSDCCATYDSCESPLMRSTLLLSILEEASCRSVDALWIGRDLGHRGGRRTGLALTDDIRFSSHAERWGVKAYRPTQGTPVTERTASVIWDMLDQIAEDIFLWNVFPLHPHPKDNVFSNRSHKAEERREGERILGLIAQLLRPKRIVAIGNDAAHSALRLFPNLEIEHVRHPSYGGQADFCRQIKQIYSLPDRKRQPELF